MGTKPREIRFADLQFNPRFEYGDQASAAQISGSMGETELGTGFVRVKNADFPWTVKYDEVLLVVEGEITVKTPQGEYHAKAQDSIWLPKGTELRYIAEDALVFYAIHPANWADN